jgi:hypothetical protein
MTSFSLIFGFLVITLEYYHEKHPHSHSTGRTLRHCSYWLKVCKKILLGLSDTLLLTGLAMQISVFLLHCTLSIYYFWIAVNLAYLSTIAHLLTMVALKSYFIEHWVRSIPRLVFLILNIGLFCYEVFVLYGLDYLKPSTDKTQKLACYYQHNRPSLKNSTFSAYWFTIIACVIFKHVIIFWHIFKDIWRGRKARSMYEIWLSQLPIVLVVFYISFAFISAVPVLRETEAMGTPPITIDNTSVNEKDWTFGQLLPVLLLAAPALAGWETICGKLFDLISSEQ